MNIFEETYQANEEAEKKYLLSTTEEQKRAALEIGRKAMDKLEAMDDNEAYYSTVYNFYCRSRHNENSLIDYDENYYDIGKIVKVLRNTGIKEITYSARSTDTIEALAEFEKAECTIEGLVEIKDGIRCGRPATKHAIKIKIN